MIPKNIRDVKKIETFVNKWNFYESSSKGNVFNDRKKFILCECNNDIKFESISIS